MGSSTHAFDLEAEVEPIPNLEDEEDDGGGGGEFGMDVDDFNPDTVDNDEAGDLMPLTPLPPDLISGPPDLSFY